MPYKDPIKAKANRRAWYLKNRDKRIMYSQKWAEENRDKSNKIKRKSAENNPVKRKEAWSKYNNSEVGRLKKHQWYDRWARNLGVRTWDEWVEYRKANGQSNGVYPSEFNKELKKLILKRDNHQCQSCFMIDPLSKILWSKSLAVHHIDYDKKNCHPSNLTTLCIRCNAKANYYKEYWKVIHKIKQPKVCVVIPSIRGEIINTMLNVWRKELKDTTILIIEDNEDKTFDLRQYDNVLHFSHNDVKKDLGDDEWIISKKTSAVCSYGFYKAYQMGFDVTIKMDDDLLVREEGFVQKHIKELFTPRPLYWMNVFSNNRVYPRGFPYTERIRPTVLNYGLSDNILDLDAPTQILGQNSKISGESMNVPYGCYLPLCGMNVAFLTEITPAYYFGLQGGSWGIDRFDDIFAGIFLKKITDHIGHVISVGQPIVTHNKLSDPLSNLKKESGGLDINEILWQAVNDVRLTKYSYKDCFIELADKIDLGQSKYGSRLKEAMVTWAKLF